MRGRRVGWSCGIGPLGPRPAPAASGKLPRRLAASATRWTCSEMFPGPVECPSEPLLCCPSPPHLPSVSWTGLPALLSLSLLVTSSRSSLLCALLLNLQLFALHEALPESSEERTGRITGNVPHFLGLFAAFDNGRVPASSPPPRSCSSLSRAEAPSPK